MKKTLESGLVVEDQQYYRMLDWIDKNPIQFNKFCDFEEIPFPRRSLNRFTKEEYYLLVIELSHIIDQE